MLNLRIDETGIRFRISASELQDLLEGKSLSCTTAAGAPEVVSRVIPSEEAAMRLDMQGMCFTLFVPTAEIKRLRDLGKSKSGIVGKQGMAEIALQVDLKSPVKKAA
jgi:hypothetical protein